MSVLEHKALVLIFPTNVKKAVFFFTKRGKTGFLKDFLMITRLLQIYIERAPLCSFNLPAN
jgi:hypothetical protein